MPRLRSIRRPSSATTEEKALLVLLHGLGSDEQDLMGATDGIDRRFEIASLRAPIPYEGGGFAWFSLGWEENRIVYDSDQAKESMTLIGSDVAELSRELGIPAHRVVLGGFSQGAMMSLAVLLNDPGSLGGAVLLSGAVIPELVPDESSPDALVPVLIHHGTYDPVLPVQLGRNVRDLLTSRGFSPAFREFPIAHGISPESLSDAEQWLVRFIDDSSQS